MPPDGHAIGDMTMQGLDNNDNILLSYLKRTYEAKGAFGGEGQPEAFCLVKAHGFNKQNSEAS